MTRTAEEISRNMRNIKSKNTRPEIFVRKLIYSLGYRYRIHYKGLPGKPDLVFAGKNKVIFVNGCFWHGHYGCTDGRIPKANAEYWKGKIEKNKMRDKIHEDELRSLGWDVLVMWECEIENKNQRETIVGKIHDFLTGQFLRKVENDR